MDATNSFCQLLRHCPERKAGRDPNTAVVPSAGLGGNGGSLFFEVQDAIEPPLSTRPSVASVQGIFDGVLAVLSTIRASFASYARPRRCLVSKF